MSFQDAVRTCLQKKYVDFSGRARRSEFWYWILFTAIVSTVANIIDAILGTRGAFGGRGVVGVIATLALLLPTLAVLARRLHDTGRSTSWVLLYAPIILSQFVIAGPVALAAVVGLVTLVALIVLIVFCVQDSKPDNEYGPNPKGLGGQNYQEMPPPAAPQY